MRIFDISTEIYEKHVFIDEKVINLGSAFTHNPEVVGSSPASATKKERPPIRVVFSFSWLAKQARIELRVMSRTSVARWGSEATAASGGAKGAE